MLSHKWTFFLASLVVLLALALVVPYALADDFATELSVEDVSFADKSFPEYQHDNQVEFNRNTSVHVKFDKVVDYRGPEGGNPVNLPPGENFDDFEDTGVFTHHDVVVLIYNEIGQVFATRTGAGSVVIEPRDRNQHDGKNYTITFNTRDPDPRIEDHNRVLVYIKQGGVTAVDPAVAEADSKNAEGSVAFNLVYSDGRDVAPDGYEYPNNEGKNTEGAYKPAVYGISRLESDLRFNIGVIEPFKVKIRLSERPKTFTTDHINVVEGKATDVILLRAVNPYILFGASTRGQDVRYRPATGRGLIGVGTVYYEYLVTIDPKFENKNDIVIKINEFEDLVKPTTRRDPNAPYKYTPPTSENEYVEGFDKLTVKVGKEDPKDKTAGLEVVIAKEIRIPASGFTVFAKNNAGSGIKDNPENDKDEPKASARTPAQLLYNLVELGGLPNLETFLANGGTIDLVAPTGVYISEIMWGSDASLKPSNNSQWIEVANSGTTSILTGDKTHKLIFYGPNETLPAVSTVADRVGTVGAGGYWSVAGKGQSGRTGTDEIAADVVAVVPTLDLVSMQRSMAADGTPADGTMASSWAESTAPALNFDATKVGVRVGTPGAAPAAYPTPPPVVTPAPAVPVAMPADIMITEIMVDTGDGRLPQWIELTNVSSAEKSLAGWSLMISNSDADADAVGASVSINLSGTLGVGGGTDAGGTMGKSLLLVAWSARSSSNLSTLGDRVMDVSDAVGKTGRYKLISDMAFMVALVPPQKTGVLTYGDTAGNLDAATAWDIPMSDGARSSLIRREEDAVDMATMGTAANGWVLASSTSLISGPATWYGSDEDAGTPGYDAGGPLPVELSHFRPARNDAGAVVITWSTQSELNNAGFYIKRSQQRDGEFQIINATMVAGAGTTSEKQFYTYEDTTAQPNVVYYYQIEDVSLDGNRQTLTNGIRLKGHIGAAGKLTTMWGDLKTQE